MGEGMMRLKDKVAIITGAASGIGQATALLFAEEGARVVVADINETGGEGTVAQAAEMGREAVFVKADISREDDASEIVEAALQAFHRVDILVNNAAAFVMKGLDATVKDWQRSLDTNVIGTALVSRYAAAQMKKFGGGAIVNISSQSAFYAQPNFITYSSTKAAIVEMTRCMALDLASANIRVNTVCPGAILTAASFDQMGLLGLTLEQFEEFEGSKTILKRIGKPREVAYTVLFLASDEASYITGAHVLVDGGKTAL
jgi:NAD(P)-dependent dehydrogenase (short-subunit alcohol dehydrogenase family)